MESLIAQGDRLFVEEDFEGAIAAYTKVIDSYPECVAAYESRSLCNLKTEQYLEAVQDASKAIELTPKNHKAYLRKGMALFNLDEFEAAKEAFEQGYNIEQQATFRTWIRKCEAELGDNDAVICVPAEKAKATSSSKSADAVEEPSSTAIESTEGETAKFEQNKVEEEEVKEEKEASKKSEEEEAAEAKKSEEEKAEEAKKAAAADEVKKAKEAEEVKKAEEMDGAKPPGVVDASKYRFQHYQIQDRLTLDVYAKRLTREQIHCSFEPRHLTLEISTPEGVSEFRLDVELFGEIHPDRCRFEVLSTKVEVVLVKATNITWPTLEKSDKIAASVAAAVSAGPGAASSAPPPPSSSTSAPATSVFPTSSRVKKDWGRLDHELSELEEKGELDAGDPLNNFFKRIFRDGDESTRRAMMKSFVESNGTVLSTNWSEVGTKKVECTPPDGMDVKKWSDS